MDVERELKRKASGFKKTLRKRRIQDVFQRVCYISPENIIVVNYPRSRPLAAFNPGASLLEDEVFIFPRLVFDYYTYNSSIGMFSIGIKQLLENSFKRPINTKIVIWPDKAWEFGHGCEDARVCSVGEKTYILYTGSKHYGSSAKSENEDSDEIKKEVLVKKSVQAFALWNKKKGTFEKLGYLRIKKGSEEYIPDCKDSALLGEKNGTVSILFRPSVEGFMGCWKGEMDSSDLFINIDSTGVVMGPEEWESKIGWSTNAVELENGKFLVGWHGVMKDDFSYANGLALVNAEGELLKVSDYLLAPKGLVEYYGDRGGVIFGDGLILYEDLVIWIGGVSDYCIGVFVAKLEKILKNMREV